MSQYLGMSITGDQLASVMVDDVADVVSARNAIDLTGVDAEGVFGAVSGVIETVPFEPARIVVACSIPELRRYLLQRIGEAGQGWSKVITVVDGVDAYMSIAGALFIDQNVVAVADIGPDARLRPGLSLAVVDARVHGPRGVVETPPAPSEPLNTPEGALWFADLLATVPSVEGGPSGIVLIGPGVDVTGVASAIEYGAGLPVQVAHDPVFASATAAVGLADRRTPEPTKRRWAVLAAVAVAAIVVLGGLTIAAFVSSGKGDPVQAEEPTPTSTPTSGMTLTFTSTSAGAPLVRTRVVPTPTTDTERVTVTERPRTETVTPPAETETAPQQTIKIPITVTRTVTLPPTSTSQTQTTTSTTQEPAPASAP